MSHTSEATRLHALDGPFPSTRLRAGRGHGRAGRRAGSGPPGTWQPPSPGSRRGRARSPERHLGARHPLKACVPAPAGLARVPRTPRRHAAAVSGRAHAAACSHWPSCEPAPGRRDPPRAPTGRLSRQAPRGLAAHGGSERHLRITVPQQGPPLDGTHPPILARPGSRLPSLPALLCSSRLGGPVALFFNTEPPKHKHRSKMTKTTAFHLQGLTHG